MNYKRLDLNLLVALDALLSERNITRAGKRIFLSQPATSAALARLREYFGDPLLLQAGHQLVLSPLGQRLLPAVRELLIHVDATVSTRFDFEPRTASRRFSVLASDYVTAVLLSDLPRRLQQTAPGISLDVLPMIDPVDRIERGEADFLIIPQQFASPDHPQQPLFDDTHMCAAWSGNSVLTDTLSAEQYAQLGHVVASRSWGRIPDLDRLFHRHFGATRRVEMSVPAWTLVCPMVVGTDRIATVPTRLAQVQRGCLPIKLFCPPIPVPPQRETLQWHKHKGGDPAMLWFRDLLRQVAQSFCYAEELVATPPGRQVDVTAKTAPRARDNAMPVRA